MKQLLKNKDYMLYWFATAFSMAASNLVQFVLSLYVLALTGSATLFASMLAITFLPRLLLAPVSGVVGDRWPIKPALIILGIISGVALLGYGAFMALGGQLSLIAIYLLVILLEAVETLYSGPSARMVPTIVPKELLKEASALSTVDDGIVGILTPVLGALLYATFGMMGSCFVAGGLFMVSVILKLGINLDKDKQRKAQRAKEQKTTPVKDFTDGLKALKENPVMMKFALNALMVNFFVSPVTIVFNYFILEKMKVGEATYGMVNSIIAAISVTVPLVVLPFVKKMSVFKLLPKGFAGIGLGVFIMLMGTGIYSWWQAPMGMVLATLIIGLGVLDIFATVLNILTSAAFPYLVEEEYWARTSSMIGVLAMLAIPLGQLLYGWMADTISVQSPLALSVLGCAASVFITLSMVKSIPGEVHQAIEEDRQPKKEVAAV